MEDLTKYEKHYSEESLADKIARYATKAGIKVVYAALLLYYVLKSPLTTKGDRAKIIGALGYFVLPIDLLPDTILIIGYTDDLAALTWAIYAVAKNITPEIKAQAKAKLAEWFGEEYDEDQLAALKETFSIKPNYHKACRGCGRLHSYYRRSSARPSD